MSTLAPTTAPVPVAALTTACSRAARTRATASVAVPGGARPVGGGLVLTRRGRRVLRAAVLAALTSGLAVGLVLLWLAVASVVAPGAVAGDGGEGVRTGVGASGAVSTTSVVVGPGDTLWELARAHAPERDPRSVVQQIVELNALSSTGVQVGATVLVPTR